MTKKIQEVPLSALHFGHECPTGSLNSRRTDRDRDIPKFADNLATFGMLLPLLIKNVKGTLYVAAGNRRLAALRHIAGQKANGKLTRLDLNKIPTLNIGDDDALELSMIENTEREPLHPVDRYETYFELHGAGRMTVEEIAARHGTSVRKVDQALALGALIPDVRDAWRSGRIDADGAKKLTMVDAKAQKKVLAQFNKWDEIGAYDITQALKLDHDINQRARLLFVGVDVYEGAGGRLTKDLFGDNHIIHNPEILDTLAFATIESTAHRMRQHDDWLWVEPWFKLPSNAAHLWQQFPSAKIPTRQQIKRIAELEEMKLEEDDVEVAACRAEMDVIESAIAVASYTPEARKKSGCILTVSNNGALVIIPGMVRPEDEAAERKRQSKAASAGAGAGTNKPAEKKAAEPSGALIKRMDTQLAAAVRVAILEDAKAQGALAVALAKLVAGEIVPDRIAWAPSSIRDAVRPLGDLVAPKIMTARLLHEFDADDYFASAPKALVVQAIQTCAPKEVAAPGFGKHSKGELAAIARKVCKGWIPPELRLRSYAGPGAKARGGKGR